MNDQEQITDLIFCEKKMSANYNEFASECVDPKLREEFLDILEEKAAELPLSLQRWNCVFKSIGDPGLQVLSGQDDPEFR